MDILYRYSQHLSGALTALDASTFTECKTLSLNCCVLPKQGEEGDCRFNPLLINFFQPLMLTTSPVLYWFEISSNHTTQEIYARIPTLNTEIGRSVPAFKKGFNCWESRVLYVGKVKSKITDRMVVHLGYGRNNMTQGLQLCHWANKIDLQLKLNYIPLPDSLIDLVGVFESRLAAELKPIFGKHK